MATPPQFDSHVWLLKGLTGSAAGRLELKRDRLRFSTRAGVLFDVPLRDVSGVTYPWYYFGGGMKVRVGETQYRFSFVRPNGAEHAIGRALGEAGNPAALLVAGGKIGDIRSGRALGRRWRAVFDAVRQEQVWAAPR